LEMTGVLEMIGLCPCGGRTLDARLDAGREFPGKPRGSREVATGIRFTDAPSSLEGAFPEGTGWRAHLRPGDYSREDCGPKDGGLGMLRRLPGWHQEASGRPARVDMVSRQGSGPWVPACRKRGIRRGSGIRSWSAGKTRGPGSRSLLTVLPVAFLGSRRRRALYVRGDAFPGTP